MWTVQDGFWGSWCVLFLSATFNVGVWGSTDCGDDGLIEMQGVVVFRHVVFIFGDCSSCLLFVVFFEKKSVLADDWVWVVFLVKDVGKLVVSKLALEKWNELMSLSFVAVKRGGGEVKFEQGIGFLRRGVLSGHLLESLKVE